MFLTMTTNADRPRKRPRKVISCARCRQRKIKCDFDTQKPCSKCSAAYVECTEYEPQQSAQALAPPHPSEPAPTPFPFPPDSIPTPDASNSDTSDPLSNFYSVSHARSEILPRMPGLDAHTHSPLDGLELLSEASIQHTQHAPLASPHSPISSPAGTRADDSTLSQMLEANTDSSSPRTTKSSPSSFIYIGSTNPLSCLLQEQDKARIVDRTAGYRALMPRRPPTSPRPRRDYPGQPISELDWYGAFASAGFDLHQLRYLDKTGCFTLPPTPVLHSLVDTYFVRVHPLYPVLDRPLFEEALRSEDPQDMPPLVLLRAVLLMGARFSVHPWVLAGTAGTRQCCDKLYSCARALYLADLGFENLSMIQAGLLMSLHWEGLDGSNTAFAHLGTAIRLAQGMGCHRPATTRKLRGQAFVAKPGAWTTSGTGTPPSEAPRQLSLLRRIWWCAVAIDRFMAVNEGTSPMIGEHDASLLSPLNDDDFRHEESIVGAVCTANISLAGILYRILTTQYQPATARWTPGSADPGEEAEEVRRMQARVQLEFELTQLPMKLKEEVRLPGEMSGESRPAHVWAAFLHLHYLGALITLHRPYIPLSAHQPEAGGRLAAMADPLGTASRAACRRAAEDVVQLLSSVSDADALRYAWPFSVYTLVSALLVSFQDLRVGGREAARRYDAIVELLRRLGGTWWAAAAKYRLALVIREGFIRATRDEDVGGVFGHANAGTFVDDQDSWMGVPAGPSGSSDTMSQTSHTPTAFWLETPTEQQETSAQMAGQPLIPLDDAFWQSLGLDPGIFGPAGNLLGEYF